MVQSGKERALRTKVHFNSIVLLDGPPPPSLKSTPPTQPFPARRHHHHLQLDVTHQQVGTIVVGGGQGGFLAKSQTASSFFFVKVNNTEITRTGVSWSVSAETTTATSYLLVCVQRCKDFQASVFTLSLSRSLRPSPPIFPFNLSGTCTNLQRQIRAEPRGLRSDSIH